jgi:hypothetical protein
MIAAMPARENAEHLDGIGRSVLVAWANRLAVTGGGGKLRGMFATVK